MKSFALDRFFFFFYNLCMTRFLIIFLLLFFPILVFSATTTDLNGTSTDLDFESEKGLDFQPLGGGNGGTYEDFTTYIEKDDNNHLTITATRAESVSPYVNQNEDVYLYKDYGVDYFDAINAYFEVYQSSNTNQDASGFGTAFTDVVNAGIQDLGTAGISSYNTKAGVGDFRLYLMRGNYAARDYWADMLQDTLYYCRMQRTAGSDTATLEIRTGSHTGVLKDVLTVSGFGTDKWRYIYGFISRNIGEAGYTWAGYYQNLDIGEEEEEWSDADALAYIVVFFFGLTLFLSSFSLILII